VSSVVVDRGANPRFEVRHRVVRPHQACEQRRNAPEVIGPTLDYFRVAGLASGTLSSAEISVSALRFSSNKMADTISQFAGIYHERAPHEALREHVRCVWVNDLSESQNEPTAPK
jgi:hypothetical protein